VLGSCRNRRLPLGSRELGCNFHFFPCFVVRPRGFLIFRERASFFSDFVLRLVFSVLFLGGVVVRILGGRVCVCVAKRSPPQCFLEDN
jgi:hypothetical protein